MKSDPAIDMLEEMIRADLELAFDHLINGDTQLARHQLQNALEKLGQIEEVKGRKAPVQQEMLKG